MGPVTLSPVAAAKLSISGQSPAANQSWGLSYQPVPKAVPSPCLIWTYIRPYSNARNILFPLMEEAPTTTSGWGLGVV